MSLGWWCPKHGRMMTPEWDRYEDRANCPKCGKRMETVQKLITGGNLTMEEVVKPSDSGGTDERR